MKPDVLMQLLHTNIADIKSTIQRMQADLGRLAGGFDALAVGLEAVTEVQSDLEARVAALEAKGGKP
jgi:hypothetical protein